MTHINGITITITNNNVVSVSMLLEISHIQFCIYVLHQFRVHHAGATCQSSKTEPCIVIVSESVSISSPPGVHAPKQSALTVYAPSGNHTGVKWTRLSYVDHGFLWNWKRPLPSGIRSNHRQYRPSSGNVARGKPSV